MKGVLLDENIPYGFSFSPELPVFHVRDLQRGATDSLLWNHAREREWIIVTKDADFAHRIMMSPPPPWIVHLRFGNCTTREFQALLTRLWPEIIRLLPEHKLVQVYNNRIEAVAG